VQRKHHYAIVDEVDSVLIDDARTPLIISGPTAKGENQQFDELKPKIEKLVSAQKNLSHRSLPTQKNLFPREKKRREASFFSGLSRDCLKTVH